MSTRRKSTRTKITDSISQGKPTENGSLKSRYEFSSTRKTKAGQESEGDEPPSQDGSDVDGAEYTPQSKSKRRLSSTLDARKTATTPTRKRRKAVSDDEELKTYDSDALDDDSDEGEPAEKKQKKKKNSSESPAKSRASRKKRKQTEENEEFDLDLEEGQEVVGIVVQAPKTGRVPPGQISKNTLDFLNKLRDPACNDREWFKLHEPVYRLAEKEWKDFVESFTDTLIEVDPQIPHLPPKDVIHRIYRDIRFSNDKTPYKKGFSASFSRSGRKGIFACCQCQVIILRAGNESMIGAGSWCPGRNELATIRSNIQRNSRRLRNVISAPQFVKYFGKPTPHPKGESQNIFGYEDELKVAPKGVDKGHKDIDLLKCRSFVVSHQFTDSEVLAPDFKERLAEVARIMQPFVHCLNDMMTINGGNASSSSEEEEEE